MAKFLEGYEHVKVLGARAVIKIETESNTRPSGLILMKEQEDPKFEGVVVATGEGVRLETGVQMPMEVEPGERVIYSRLAGVPIEYNGEKLLVINERDIIAVIEDTPKVKPFDIHVDGSTESEELMEEIAQTLPDGFKMTIHQDFVNHNNQIVKIKGRFDTQSQADDALINLQNWAHELKAKYNL